MFFDIETTIKTKLGSILEKLTQRHNQREQADLDVNKTCTSTQFLQIQKKQLIDLQEHLERYCNVLPILGFNSVKYDLNLIKSYLLPILVNERNIEPTVIKKANQFISFKFGDIQLLEIMNLLGGAKSLDSFLKAYKTSETKKFLPYDWFDHPDKMQNPELPQYDAFYSKLRSCNPLKTKYTDYVNLLKSGLTTEQAVIKLKLWKPSPTGIENYFYLQQIWKQEQMSSFKDFLRWYNKKDIVPTLEAIQKGLPFTTTMILICWSLVVHYQTRLTFAYTNPLMQKVIPSQREIKTYWKKFKKTSWVAHLSCLHAKQLMMKLLSQSLQTYENLMLGLMPANYTPTRCATMCQPMPTGLYTRWDFDSETSGFTPRQNKTLRFENMVMSYFQRTNMIVKLRASTLQAGRRKLIASVLRGFVLIVMLCLKHWVALTTFAPVKSCTHISPKRISNVAVGEQNSTIWDEAIYRRKVSLSLKCGNVGGGDFTRQPTMLHYKSERVSVTDDHLQNNNY